MKQSQNQYFQFHPNSETSKVFTNDTSYWSLNPKTDMRILTMKKDYIPYRQQTLSKPQKRTIYYSVFKKPFSQQHQKEPDPQKIFISPIPTPTINGAPFTSILKFTHSKGRWVMASIRSRIISHRSIRHINAILRDRRQLRNNRKTRYMIYDLFERDSKS